MLYVSERVQAIWNSIRESPTVVPTRVAIPPEHVDRGSVLGGQFQRDTHYFQVRVNEMFLAASRQWTSGYDPLVFVVSEFIYNKKVEAVPFVVGPSLMEKYGQSIPDGMLFTNTRVAGLHPYRGGPLTLSVVLCRVQRRNYAREILQLVERAAGAIDFATALGAYVKIADVVLGGVETLLGLGETVPLVGLRTSFDTDAGDGLRPGYFALIDAPETSIDPGQLWVRESGLVYGRSLAEARPFRTADYVLYSIAQTTERTDYETLPFSALFDHVIEAAAKNDDESWKSAKANMLTMYQLMVRSPDLTLTQAKTLKQQFVDQMIDVHEAAASVLTLGEPPENETSPEIEASMREAVDILDL